MSIHVSNFGQFSSGLDVLADVEGYVPEAGDAAEMFAWGHDDFEVDVDRHGDGYEGRAAEMWRTHLAECATAIAGAEAAVSAWRGARAVWSQRRR